MKSTNAQRYLYIVVFISGMTTLAIEITASRLLGHVFGTSNLVWANIIGLMLLFLTLGYFIGGRIADRSTERATLYRIVVVAAFLSGLIPLAATPVLDFASRAVIDAAAGLAIGSFIAVLVLFALPVILMGMVSPFAIRLAVPSVEDAGRVAGQIYALSTLGSLLGTWLPVLVTVPLLGTTRTFLLFSAILFTAGLVGLVIERGARGLVHLWMAAVVLVLGGLTETTYTRAALSDQFTVIYQGESAYNYIQVQEHSNGTRYLFLNEGQGIHSRWHPEQITYQQTWSFFLTAPYFRDPAQFEVPDSMLVVGLAAGTIPRQHALVYPEMRIDGVEIDPEIIQVGRDYFGMNANEIPNLTTYAQDGRFVLNQLNTAYDVVAVDAYRPPYIPWHLTTVEFFQEIDAKLTPNGVVAINVGRTTTDRRLVDAMSATLAEVFSSVHAIDVPATFNTILIATRQPTTVGNLRENLTNPVVTSSQILQDTLNLASDHIVPVEHGGIVFTDDHAPVESLVDSIVLNFILSDDVEQIR